ncbi:hypothetical protein PQX77_020353 [Marasmius sp. AFHP31]|nr:hypothetical protein PQX77_020353 [Marasmius sp. AFHP31]
MTTYFPNAQGTTIGANANFQAIAGNSTIIHNYNTSEREDRLTLRGRTVRKVIDGDIIFQRVLSSKVLCVKVKPEGVSTSTEPQVVRVKKMEQTAEIYGYQGKFTATSFEPVDEKDRGVFEQIRKVVLEAAMGGRSALLKQVFAMANSENVMTLIAHDGRFPAGNLDFRPSKAVELVGGDEFSDQYWDKDWIVSCYLDYRLGNAIQALRDDETLRFPVTTRYSDWSFNVKNLTWIYDPAAHCLDPPGEKHFRLIVFPPPPLCQVETPQQLNTTETVAHVEKSFGDVLHLIASVGKRWITRLPYYARHGLLTFGAVVNRRKPGNLAHLVSTPSPEWFCQSRNPDVKAKFSSSGRVDLSFRKTGNVQVELDFGWHIPERNLRQLQCAFLCQSLHLVDNCYKVKDIVFIDMLGFRLQGTFPNDPTNHPTPAYLFVNPPPTEFIHNTYCVSYPFSDVPFYWSHDPQGSNAIAEEDWERCGIPELSVMEWIGDYWKDEDYARVQEHLRSRSYSPDGKQYAYDHGHPEFIFADPHETARLERIVELEDWISEHEFSLSPPRLASSSEPLTPDAPLLPSTPSPADTPVFECNNVATSMVTHWARPGFLNKWYNLVSETVTQADDLGYSVAAC